MRFHSIVPVIDEVMNRAFETTGVTPGFATFIARRMASVIEALRPNLRMEFENRDRIGITVFLYLQILQIVI